MIQPVIRNSGLDAVSLDQTGGKQLRSNTSTDAWPQDSTVGIFALPDHENRTHMSGYVIAHGFLKYGSRMM